MNLSTWISAASILRRGDPAVVQDDRDTFFPASFRILYSEDSITYHHLIEETGFMAEPGTWYRWRFLPTNIRFLKLDIAGVRLAKAAYRRSSKLNSTRFQTW